MSFAMHFVVRFGPALAGLYFTVALNAQQVPDPKFDTTVAHPAYTGDKHPKVLFDEAHFNVHTTQGSYAAFTTIMINDGYAVTPTTKPFDAASLAGFDILVISNARGEARPTEKPAFTEAECDAVRNWVEAGGSLLLIVDHYPTGHNAEAMARRFNVDLSKGTTQDPGRAAPAGAGGPSTHLFTREAQALGDHLIMRGRNDGEKLNKVMIFTGSSLKGPEGSTPLLLLSDKAVDVMTSGAGTGTRQGGKKKGAGKQASTVGDTAQKPAASRNQGLAMTFGKGRVVVLGEASELSAQITGPQQRPMGMNYPGTDNRQWALNIMHWLSGLY